MEADLLVSRVLNADELDDVEQAFRAVGLDPNVRRVPVRRGPEELTWLVLAALPLSSFLSTLGSKLAEDSYKQLRLLTRRVLGKGASPARILILEDSASGTRVVLERDLPDSSYRALVDAGRLAESGGTMRFDRDRAHWVVADG